VVGKRLIAGAGPRPSRRNRGEPADHSIGRKTAHCPLTARGGLIASWDAAIWGSPVSLLYLSEVMQSPVWTTGSDFFNECQLPAWICGPGFGAGRDGLWPCAGA